MTESSRPFDGTATGDAGPYSSADWAQNWDYSFAKGVRANVGPFLDSGTNPQNGLEVHAQSPAAAAVDVYPGSALVNGRWYLSDAIEAQTIGANSSGSDRIDTVVLRCDYSLQTIRLAVLPGTPAGSPTPPTLTQTDLVTWEIPLADVYVANGFTSIAETDITPRAEWANAAPGVFLTALNNSGGVLTTGAPVKVDSTADRAITTTSTAGDPAVVGVWVGRTSNGGYGLVLTEGIGLVYVDGAVAKGSKLKAKGTGGQATITYGDTYFARVLVATTGAGLALCYVHREIVPAYVRCYEEETSGTVSGSFTSGAWRTRVLNKITDSQGIASLASNQITLPAGTYIVHAFAPAYLAGSHKCRLQNITDGATLVEGGQAGSSASDTMSVNALLMGRFSISGSKVIELQHWCNTSRANNGFGLAATTGDAEIYASVEFWRIGD